MEASLAQSLQAFEVERKLHGELREAMERIVTLELELSSCRDKPSVGHVAPASVDVATTKLEARAKILQTENRALRMEAFAQKKKHHDLLEELAAAREEARENEEATA